MGLSNIAPGGGAIVWGEESYTDRWAFLYRNEREPVLLRLRTNSGPTTKLYSFIPLCSSASEAPRAW